MAARAVVPPQPARDLLIGSGVHGAAHFGEICFGPDAPQPRVEGEDFETIIPYGLDDLCSLFRKSFPGFRDAHGVTPLD
ncbi:hypothetical protein [Saccharopolyspora hattusasensis]|uniref:hypothetical protein n=1 Tax=Saccharopolyspora hattusasensis TaxID=1128679 RepID=UPI003D9579B5